MLVNKDDVKDRWKIKKASVDKDVKTDGKHILKGLEGREEENLK